MKKLVLLLISILSFEMVNAQCNPPSQEICMVTADTVLHTYAVVIWEKVVTDEIDSFFIYRRNALNLYDKIGATHYSAPGEFYDFGVDLNQNFSGLYKYKISTLDTCGNESLKSNYHKPIHLIYTGLGNFQYDDYQIEAITPNYFFELFIDFTGVGNTWQIINSVPPGIYDMQDPAYAANGGAVYHVRATLPASCDPTRTGVNTSRSNIKNQSVTNGMKELSEAILQIFPNPANESIKLSHVPGLILTDLRIINSLGQVVRNVNNPGQTLSINDLEKGIYLFQFTSNAGILSKTLIIE